MIGVYKHCLCFFLMFGITCSASAQEKWMPDANLRQAVREALKLPADSPLTKETMEQLTYLEKQNNGIRNIQGLEFAQNLENLNLGSNQVRDIRPLRNLVKLRGLSLYANQASDLSPLRSLTLLVYLNAAHNPVTDLSPLSNHINLETLDLFGCQISDVSPLIGLKNLKNLILTHNRISDFSPLADLTNLRRLYIKGNLANDISSLQNLTLTEFEYDAVDAVCEIAPLGTSIISRIQTRDYPSVFQAWDDLIGLEKTQENTESWDNEILYTEHLTKHDLHWSSFFGLEWNTSAAEPTYGLSTRLGGDLEEAKAVRQQQLILNPNMVFLVEIRLHNHFNLDALPPNSNFWLRNTIGDNVKNNVAWDEYSLDILNSGLQQLLINRIVGIAECGLFDGVLLDGFNNQGAGYYSHLNIGTDEEIIEAHARILKGVRERVRDDFLILANASDQKIPRHSEYINGSFMEIGPWHHGGYNYKYLQKIEDTLLWNEKNLRSPQINSLRPQGFGQYPPNAPENKRWMRLFTTMSLTHSDGYILYTTGRSDFFNGFDEEGKFIPHHEHIWYSFWDAPLGGTLGGDETKGVLYRPPKGKEIEGLFIREFTNGYAVYNRSGKTQEIELPQEVTGWASGVENQRRHTLADLDGEIYLKSGLQTPPTVDVNGDGTVNILDLVAVANGFGKDTPDVNGDGVVNILDLVAVANAFGQ